ncbi:MAG: OmpH family outer membrane protein [Gemmatimonadales bacterium]
MKRRTVLLLTIAPAMLLMMPTLARAQGGSPCATSKVAIVQGAAILNSMPQYLQAESLLVKDQDAYKLELAKMQGLLDSAVTAFQDKSTLLSATAKSVEQRKLQDQNQALQQHQAELEQKFAGRRQELVAPIEQRVQDVIDGMRAEYSCAIIFDASAQGSNIASVDKSIDLTQRVIDRLKAAGSVPTTPRTTKPPAGIKPPAAVAPKKP